MEISERELRSLTVAADGLHRHGMATVEADVRELHAATRTLRSSRRELFTRAAAAGAVAIGATAVPLVTMLPAAAQEDEEDALDDEAIASFAESVELAAVDAYGRAVASGLLPSPLVQVGQTFAGHHTEHATAFAALSGGTAKGEPNPRLVVAIGDQLRNAHDDDAVLRVLLDVENAASATYLFGLGILQDRGAQQLAASILPVESQHAVVLGQALGNDLESIVPTFENQDRAVDPAVFPVEPTTTTTTSTTTK